jgi:hypothetical protein
MNEKVCEREKGKVCVSVCVRVCVSVCLIQQCDGKTLLNHKEIMRQRMPMLLLKFNR